MGNRPLIAIVNDDTAFLTLMEELLRDEGYNTFIHTMGNTAYDRIREVIPALVVLDIRMDNQASGWHVLEMLRLDPRTRAIPVIVCSADSVQLREKAERLEKHNAVPLEKPFDLDELLACVQRFVGHPGD